MRRRLAEFCELVYRLRTEAGLTQADLARRMGTTLASVSTKRVLTWRQGLVPSLRSSITLPISAQGEPGGPDESELIQCGVVVSAIPPYPAVRPATARRLTKVFVWRRWPGNSD